MDLAVIKTTVDMPYLQAGDSSVVQTGEDVIAIGTPLTLQFKHTVTKGIISATNRTVELENERRLNKLIFKTCFNTMQALTQGTAAAR